MKALSILQPWAWLIVHGHKDIENRGWHTAVRGRILVHVGKTYSRDDHDFYTEVMAHEFRITLPAYADLPRGGIVGAVDIVDCVQSHPSRWKQAHSWGFVLANPEVQTFRPYRGQLMFFEVPTE